MRPATQTLEPPSPPRPALRAVLLGREGQVIRRIELPAVEEPLAASRLLAEAMRAQAWALDLELAPLPPVDPSGEELRALWRLARAASLAGLERVRYRRKEGEAWMELTLERKSAS